MTYHCHKCERTFLIRCEGPGNEVGVPRYCPWCSSPMLTEFTPNEHGQWEHFAGKYGLTPELAKQVYLLWDVNLHETFEDHLADLLKED